MICHPTLESFAKDADSEYLNKGFAKRREPYGVKDQNGKFQWGDHAVQYLSPLLLGCDSCYVVPGVNVRIQLHKNKNNIFLIATDDAITTNGEIYFEVDSCFLMVPIISYNLEIYERLKSKMQSGLNSTRIISSPQTMVLSLPTNQVCES